MMLWCAHVLIHAMSRLSFFSFLSSASTGRCLGRETRRVRIFFSTNQFVAEIFIFELGSRVLVDGANVIMVGDRYRYNMLSTKGATRK